MKSRLAAVLAFFALSLAACGGGGGGGTLPSGPQPGGSPTPPQSTPTVKPSTGPTQIPTSGPTQSPTTGPTTKPTTGPTTKPTTGPTSSPTTKPTTGPTPTTKPTIAPTPTPTQSSTPSPTQSYYPPDPPSVLTSTYGKIGLAQIFDYYPSDNTNIPTSQAQADAHRYNFVWGSFPTQSDPNRPSAWRQGNASILVSRYYIIEEDNVILSGNNLAWFQQNHPDWILYACNSSGQMTNDYAYDPGVGFPDVPLNFENPAVKQYQVQGLINYAKANGYNAIALDQVIFSNFMVGGNPKLGQTENTSEYACGTRNNDGTANIIYSGKTDPKFTSDILSWVAYAYQQAHTAGLDVAVNHPLGSATNSNETTLMANTDIMLDEPGFSDYGKSAVHQSGRLQHRIHIHGSRAVAR